MSLASELGDRFKAEFMGRAVSVISGAILIIVLARLLDPDGYGLLFLAISVLGTIQLISKLGIAKSAARYISKYKESDPDQIPHIIKFSFILNIGSILIVCILLLIGHNFLADLIGEPDLAPLLVLGVFFVAFATLATYVRLIFQGFEAIKPAGALQAIDRGLRAVLAIGFVILGYGAVGALVGYIVAHTAAAALGLGFLYFRFYRGFSPSGIEVGLRRRIAEYTVPLTATSTARIIDKRVDTILVGVFIGPIGVAYYTLSRQIIEFIVTPIEALGFTLSPTYESEKVKGNTDIAARIYEEALTHGLMLYIPAAAGLILVSEPLIYIVFGEEYAGAVPVLQILGIYAVLQSVKVLTDNGLDFLGRARERAIAKSVAAVLNLIFNIILIPRIGVIGAAVATVITDAMYTIVNVYIMHTEIKIQIIHLVRQVSVILTITLIMSIVVYSTNGFLDGFISLFVMVGVGVVTWFILVTSTGLLNTKKVYSKLT
ncbi:flippase [Natrialba swarupiae]|uniref:Flippase n=1 Tax=Natrialba swarupiae TaxID=2448032 RepID=A0A5D5AIY6_9EURY|nr:flippase [Natrialba swarupiae]TYT60985.1 flippase [Natrialba swarupiae]